MRRTVAVGLILIAGLVSYLASATGDGGPMTAFGHADADRLAANAWHQIPIHLALAGGLTVAGRSPLRRLAFGAAVAGIVLLGSWAAFLAAAVISALGDYTDMDDVATCAALVSLYAGAAFIAWPLYVRAFEPAVRSE